MYFVIKSLLAGFSLYAVWQQQELKKFRVTAYEMLSAKVNQTIKIAVLSDLHSYSYGTENERLFHAVSKENTDLILIPGDFIISACTKKFDISAKLAERLCKLGPVLYCNGNHESYAEQKWKSYADYCAYTAYRRRLKRLGVVFINNEHQTVTLRGGQVRVSGLELPLESYKKGKKPYVAPYFLKKQLGKASEDKLQILLAHHPAFAQQYARWGADLTFCGHYHGGLVNLPLIGSVISPQFMLFPKYDAGEYTIFGRKVYVSRGLGTHTFHIRIFNRAELLIVTVKPKKPATENHLRKSQAASN